MAESERRCYFSYLMLGDNTAFLEGGMDIDGAVVLLRNGEMDEKDEMKKREMNENSEMKKNENRGNRRDGRACGQGLC